MCAKKAQHQRQTTRDNNNNDVEAERNKYRELKRRARGLERAVRAKDHTGMELGCLVGSAKVTLGRVVSDLSVLLSQKRRKRRTMAVYQILKDVKTLYKTFRDTCIVHSTKSSSIEWFGADAMMSDSDDSSNLRSSSSSSSSSSASASGDDEAATPTTTSPSHHHHYSPTTTSPSYHPYYAAPGSSDDDDGDNNDDSDDEEEASKNKPVVVKVGKGSIPKPQQQPAAAAAIIPNTCSCDKCII